MRPVRFLAAAPKPDQRLVPLADGGFRLQTSDTYELQRQLDALGDPGQLAVRAQAAKHTATILQEQSSLVELWGENRWLYVPPRPRWRTWAYCALGAAALVLVATVSGYVAVTVARPSTLSPAALTTPPAPSEPPSQGRAAGRHQLQHKAVASRTP